MCTRINFKNKESLSPIVANLLYHILPDYYNKDKNATYIENAHHINKMHPFCPWKMQFAPPYLKKRAFCTPSPLKKGRFAPPYFFYQFVRSHTCGNSTPQGVLFLHQGDRIWRARVRKAAGGRLSRATAPPAGGQILSFRPKILWNRLIPKDFFFVYCGLDSMRLKSKCHLAPEQGGIIG